MICLVEMYNLHDRSNTQMKNIINLALCCKRTHYLKWQLDQHSDWSIRYFFTHDADNQYEGCWVLKSHKKKIYIILTHREARDYIRKYSNGKHQEIFATTDHSIKKYRKAIFDSRNGFSTITEYLFKGNHNR